MLVISSRDNPKIKFARKVRDGIATDFVFVEGARLAEEVFRADVEILDVFFTADFAAAERGQIFLQTVGSFVVAEVSESVFDSLSDTKNSQGIVVICRKPAANRRQIEINLLSPNLISIVVMLHQINNPANLGAILRTCEAVNVSGAIITKNSADAFSPKALRGAMGASFRLPLWTNADFDEVLDWARAKNLISVCADVKARQSYLKVDWKKPRLLVFGSEAHGLSADEFGKIDESLLIPMSNNVESLNLAVSGGVILFEAKRQIESN